MGHTYHQNYGHLVYHVRNVKMRPEDIAQIHHFITAMALQLGGTRIVVGGTDDHVHILCDFPFKWTIPQFVQRLKTRTTIWVKEIDPCYRHFAWQTGFGYFSVSASLYAMEEAYIRNQAAHHAHRSARDEFRAMLRKRGMTFYPDDEF